MRIDLDSHAWDDGMCLSIWKIDSPENRKSQRKVVIFRERRIHFLRTPTKALSITPPQTMYLYACGDTGSPKAWFRGLEYPEILAFIHMVPLAVPHHAADQE